MLRFDRTSFDKGYRKVITVVPNASTAYDELCQKYGGDNVKIASSTAADVTIEDAISMCTSNANDAVLIYPGSYTCAATINVAKNVTICGVGADPYGTIIAPGTAIVAFTLAATADYCTIKNLTITHNATAATAIDIPAACPGVVIDNVIINGGDTTTTQVGITNSSDNFVVRNSRINGVAKGIQSYGSRGLFVGNYFQHSVAGSVGIDLLSGNYGVVQDNTFALTSATAINVRIGNTAAVIGASVINNRGAATTTGIHAVSATNPLYFNNNKTSTATVVLAMVIA